MVFFNLHSLKFAELLGSVGLHLSSVFKNSHPYFVCPILPLTSSSGTPITNVLVYLILSHILDAVFFFLFIFSYESVWIIPIDLSPSSLIPPAYVQSAIIRPLSKLFDIVFFS